MKTCVLKNFFSEPVLNLQFEDFSDLEKQLLSYFDNHYSKFPRIYTPNSSIDHVEAQNNRSFRLFFPLGKKVQKRLLIRVGYGAKHGGVINDPWIDDWEIHFY